jgi:hypothetical protein
MSNFDKLKLIPNVSISGGTNKYGPIKVKKEKRNYGISGSYDVYDKKGTKITLTGNYGKSSFKDKVKFKDREFVFEDESKPSYGIGITFKKKFKNGGYNAKPYLLVDKEGKPKPKPKPPKREPFRESKGEYRKMKRGGDVMPARNKKNFRPTEKGAGMTAAGVAAYRKANPGSKLKTAVTGKVKPGSKDAKRRKSFCARSLGQMKKFPKAAKDPNSRLRQARRRWKC